MSPSDRLTIHIRLTPELIKQLKITAAENGRSMNAEIAARLDRSFGPEGQDRQAVAKLLVDALAILDQGKS